jgi:hypothetical protein
MENGEPNRQNGVIPNVAPETSGGGSVLREAPLAQPHQTNTIISSKKSTKKRRLVVGIAVAVIAIIVTAVAFLVATGRMYVGLKSPDQTIAVTYRVCDGGVISKYNEIIALQTSVEQGIFDDLMPDIQSRGNWDKDLVCVFISIQSALNNDDVAGARSLFEKYSTLITDGHQDTRVEQLAGFADMTTTEAYISAKESRLESEETDVADAEEGVIQIPVTE